MTDETTLWASVKNKEEIEKEKKKKLFRDIIFLNVGLHK